MSEPGDMEAKKGDQDPLPEARASDDSAEARASSPASVEQRANGANESKENSALLVGEARRISPALSDDAARSEMRRRSRRTFLIGGVAGIAAYGGWRWLKSAEEVGGIPAPLRRSHEFNEAWSRAYFDRSRPAREFPPEPSRIPRVNGGIGMDGDFDAAAWRLQVTGVAGNSSALTLDEIRRLPRAEMTTELKCIEGWSDLGHWAGARFADFAGVYAPATRSRYVSLETPDGGYYVGLDIESALHPQTLLCYEMGGQALTPEHGAPLRLYVPVKYGIKSLKRIGRITFTDERPRDFWAERGYDWYSGH